jgi:hypothetical protein
VLRTAVGTTDILAETCLALPFARPVFVGNFVANGFVRAREADKVSDKVSDKGNVSGGGAKHIPLLASLSQINVGEDDGAPSQLTHQPQLRRGHQPFEARATSRSQPFD